MGRLAIRRVRYFGDKYFYESPYFEDGIIIIAGENGHGKSTLMDLIYFAIGGKVNSFVKDKKNKKERHTEISEDTNNFVELEIEVDDEKFEITRSFDENRIFIVDSNEEVSEYPIKRRDRNEKSFSDWILGKLGIEVVELFQGTKNFKLSFNDLLRLMYYDQSTEIEKIYKQPDNDNFLTDSQEIRKAIFEVLIGTVFNEYYSKLGEFKNKAKELEKENIKLETHNNFLEAIYDGELDNSEYIKKSIETAYDKVELLESEREILRETKNNIELINDEKMIIRSRIIQLEEKLDEYNNEIHHINSSIENMLLLIDEVDYEIAEIKKIRFVDKKLNLFSANTCPYCLKEVKREKGKCICGSEIDEEDYEKFFYSNEEYLEILKSKRKIRESICKLLEKKNLKSAVFSQEREQVLTDLKSNGDYIKDLNKDINSDYSSAQVRKIDEQISLLKDRVQELRRTEELARKREEIVETINKLRVQKELLEAELNMKWSEAEKDIILKRGKFNQIYGYLMKKADKDCFNAIIGNDYMPYVNENSYREQSASVAKRLMYFNTLMILSLYEKTNYPRLLLIDTPKNKGIDEDKIINMLKLLDISLNAIDLEIGKRTDKKYQIIMTTGNEIYPKEFESNVVIRLENENRLLVRRE